MFDPNIGRWLEEDPIGFEAGDANLFRYVFNDPTNLTDPSGLIITALGIDLKDRNLDLHDNLGRRFYIAGEGEPTTLTVPRGEGKPASPAVPPGEGKAASPSVPPGEGKPAKLSVSPGEGKPFSPPSGGWNSGDGDHNRGTYRMNKGFQP